MRETLRVHGAAIEHELPQCGQSGCGEEGAGSPAGGPHLDQAALQHGLHRGRDLRLVASLAAAPGAQEDAVRYQRVLAEVTAQLAPQQVALGRGERGGRRSDRRLIARLVNARTPTRASISRHEGGDRRTPPSISWPRCRSGERGRRRGRLLHQHEARAVECSTSRSAVIRAMKSCPV